MITNNGTNQILTPSELECKLASINITVRRRTDGRTSEEIERWLFCHWLSTLLKANCLEFPLEFKRRNRPDFHLKMGICEIGVECTEAISESYAHGCAIAEKENKIFMPDGSLFPWGKKKEPDEIRRIALLDQLTGPGWSNDGPEKELVKAVIDIIRIKTIKLQKPGFTRYAKNVLLIYDNLPLPVCRSKLTLCLNLLQNEMKDYWTNGLIFSDVYIECCSHILNINKTNTGLWPVNDLWASGANRNN
jgi:hypothetical protein